MQQRWQRIRQPVQIAWSLQLLILSVLLCGCSDFFSAEVTGFLKRERVARDSESIEAGDGVNAAEIRIFLDQPDSFDAPDFIAHTTTIDNRSAGIELPGFFRTSIAWKSASPEHGDSGDLKRIWIATRHPDYEDRIVEFKTVQSNAINLMPDVLLHGLRRGPDRVTGEVLLDGLGIDGVRVVLTLADSELEFEGYTQTLDGRPGSYALDDVRWDEATGNESDSTIAVADPSYLTAGPVAAQLIADQIVVISEPLTVRSSLFSVKRVRGRVIDRLGQGVNGVRIVLRPDLARDPDAAWATVSTEVDGERGVYQFVDFSWSMPSSSDLFDTYDTQKVLLEVDDDVYVPAISSRVLPVAIGYLQELDVSYDLVVVRQPRSDFSALVEGRCVELSTHDSTPQGVAGVEVTATFTDEGGAHALVIRTDPEGRYNFLTEWARGEGANASADGEDAIPMELRFSVVNRGEDSLVFDPLFYEVRSWIRPNYVPDAIGALEEAEDGGI